MLHVLLQHFPLWWLAPPPCPVGSVSLDSQSPTAPCESCDTLSRGEVRRSRIGGGERSEPIRRMVILPYDADRLIRNADFISIARRAIHHPQPVRRCRPLSEAMHSEHILKERSDAQNVVSRFPCGDTTLLHNPRRSRAPLFLICGEAATTTLGPKGRQT